MADALAGSSSLANVQQPSNGSMPISSRIHSSISKDQLNKAQRQAYDIFIWHLDETLKGHEPPPLRMIIYGEGGTGKSAVIQTITDAFAERNASGILLKSAYTGIAASQIDGKTLHSIGCISIDENSQLDMSDETRAKLQQAWAHRRYLIIDEFSMLCKSFLAKLSRQIGIGRAPYHAGDVNDQSFGGINVCIIGDFHQFPPVARAREDTLFYPTRVNNGSIDSQIGGQIYQEFTTVVILKEQKRIEDKVWYEFLQTLRQGRLNPASLRMLHGLQIHHEDPEFRVDYSQPPWDDAPLITPRHAVRRRWNREAIRRFCRKHHQQLFVCPAEDTIRGKPLDTNEQAHVRFRDAGLKIKNRGKQRKQRKDLPRTVELTIGAKILVTENVETDLDIANGTRGEIVDIVLDPDEPIIDPTASEVHLKYLPRYILVKLPHTRATQLPGLDVGVVPLEPTSQNFIISVAHNNVGKAINRRVTRRQFPLTLAWAFTDYRSQGQTIPYVFIDITPPPKGKFDMFNLYVALSRSRGRKHIRILRDFSDNIFMQPIDHQLLMEDDRLQLLANETTEWWSRMNI